MYRIGQGIDYHVFEAGEYFMLGGVKIPHTMGVKAHSDGDVLLHSLCDALFGAIGEGDIGTHFPDTDPQYKNAASHIFLKKAFNLLSEKGYVIQNIDATVILERPKLKDFIPQMKEQIGEILHLSEGDISIKATTKEKMDDIGKKKGIAAHSVILIKKNS